MKEKVKVTIVNKWRYRNIDRDFLDVVNAIEENQDSDIIVFPECCLVEFKGRKDYEDKINRLKDISRKSEIIICVGLEEPVDPTDAKKKIFYNSAFLIEGNKLHKYRKIYLIWDEPKTTHYGELDFPVFETKIGKIGVLICYDNVFPESMRCLKLKGAEIICKVSAWPTTALEHWDIFTRARARENQVFLIASNDCSKQVYEDEGKGSLEVKYCGNSRIVDPFGKVLVNIDSERQPFDLATITIESKRLEEIKDFYGPNTNPMESRRPEFYQIISEV